MILALRVITNGLMVLAMEVTITGTVMNLMITRDKKTALKCFSQMENGMINIVRENFLIYAKVIMVRLDYIVVA